MNAGSELTTDRDLQFKNPQDGFLIAGPYNEDAYTVDEEGEFMEVNSARVWVNSYDYGAYGEIEAQGTVAGTTKTAHLVGSEVERVDIPRDDDDNHIADAWTYNTGNEGDDNDTSLDNQHNGDGLTRYEEYRGVDINNDDLISDASERLNPNEKDLFVQGSGLGGDFPDFAYGEAFGEAQINVHDFVGTVGTDDNNIDVLVVTLENVGGHIERYGDPRPDGRRRWTWSTKGSSTIGTANNYGSPQVNKLATNYYFDDKPHSDENTWTAVGEWNGDPNGVLDPVNPEKVEDTDDNGVLDANEKDGATSPPTDDGDNDFDGDYPVKDAPWEWNHDLSPMDIDNDGLVELPMDNEVPVPGDDEYTKAEVVRHTITHEMGHAVGITYPQHDGHCEDETCVMYYLSPNWQRDGHFCDDCRAKILIHNN